MSFSEEGTNRDYQWMQIYYISSNILYFIVCRFSGEAILQVFFSSLYWDQDGHLKVMNHSERNPRTASW